MPPSSPAAPTLDKPSPRDKHAGPRWWAAFLFVLALGAVLWGSMAPAVPTLNVSNIDKAQHFAAYGLLAVLAFLTCRARSWRAALALITLGVAVEFAQAAEGLGREGSPLDALANTGGVLLVALVWPRR